METMKTESQRLAEYSADVRKAILRRLREIPQGKENWRIQPDQLSFSDVVQHLMDADQWLVQMVEKRRYHSMDPVVGARVVQDRNGYEALLRELEESQVIKRKFIESLTGEKLNEVIDEPRFEKTSVWEAIVQGNLEHEIHHRGQIEAFLQVLKTE